MKLNSIESDMFCYPSTGHANLLCKLIKRGAVVNAMDYHGTTALHLACQKGHGSAAVS